MDWSQEELSEHLYVKELQQQLGILALVEVQQWLEMDYEYEHNYLDRMTLKYRDMDI